MKDLTFTTLIAVFEEIFGRGLFWAMVVAAMVITAAYLYVLVRDRSMSMRKFLLAQLSMPFGAIAAVLFVQLITNSGFSDIGGPIDLIVLLGVATLGAVGIAVLVYTLQSLIRSDDDDKLAIAGKCSSKGGGVSPHARTRKPLICSRKMARPKGFEPLTPRFVVWCKTLFYIG
jgi:hypothetical protein